MQILLGSSQYLPIYSDIESLCVISSMLRNTNKIEIPFVLVFMIFTIPQEFTAYQWNCCKMVSKLKTSMTKEF